MGKFQTFQQFLSGQNYQISILEFVLNLLLVTIFAYLLGVVYVRFGTSLSNRKMFARNFILLAMITMLVIAIVKSSLALSLGLVGALSIVRFRTAVKEPEELAYLFFAIALGLGFGANQGVITSIAAIIMFIVLLILKQRHLGEQHKNLLITVTAPNTGNVTLKKITDIISKNSTSIDMKRFDSKKDMLEISLYAEFDSFEQFDKAQTALQLFDKSIEMTFLDHRVFSA